SGIPEPITGNQAPDPSKSGVIQVTSLLTNTALPEMIRSTDRVPDSGLYHSFLSGAPLLPAEAARGSLLVAQRWSPLDGSGFSMMTDGGSCFMLFPGAFCDKGQEEYESHLSGDTQEGTLPAACACDLAIVTPVRALPGRV
ncbi:hypothetical protein SAMN05920897_1421, partial [Alkalispirochaeta americana]